VRRDTIRVTIEQPPQSTFPDSICAGGNLLIDPGFNPATYTWSTGETTQQITVLDTGSYSVNIQVPGEVCYRVYKYTLEYSYPDSAMYDISMCPGEPIILNAQTPGGSYQWNTGDTSSQITVSEGGYSVVINAPAWRCPYTKSYTVTDYSPDSCDRDFTLPNVFTPDNGDNLNNTFHGLTFGNYKNFLIKIFNRWGELMFESTTQHFEWDGKNQSGKNCPAGVYYFIGKLEHPLDTRELKGFVTLLRDK
jgi:gliding motility-associated-like protein